MTQQEINQQIHDAKMQDLAAQSIAWLESYYCIYMKAFQFGKHQASDRDRAELCAQELRRRGRSVPPIGR